MIENRRTSRDQPSECLISFHSLYLVINTLGPSLEVVSPPWNDLDSEGEEESEQYCSDVRTRLVLASTEPLTKIIIAKFR